MAARPMVLGLATKLNPRVFYIDPRYWVRLACHTHGIGSDSWTQYHGPGMVAIIIIFSMWDLKLFSIYTLCSLEKSYVLSMWYNKSF